MRNGEEEEFSDVRPRRCFFFSISSVGYGRGPPSALAPGKVQYQHQNPSQSQQEIFLLVAGGGRYTVSTAHPASDLRSDLVVNVPYSINDIPTLPILRGPRWLGLCRFYKRQGHTSMRGVCEREGRSHSCGDLLLEPLSAPDIG